MFEVRPPRCPPLLLKVGVGPQSTGTLHHWPLFLLVTTAGSAGHPPCETACSHNPPMARPPLGPFSSTCTKRKSLSCHHATCTLHCKTDESHATSQVYKNAIGPDDKCYFPQQHKDQSFVILCLLDRYSFPVPFVLYQGEM
jgi:hypothetical protein